MNSTRVDWDVIGIGANSVDYVYRLPAYPQSHGAQAKMRITSHAVTCGGQVVTALATCAAMGLRAKYVGSVGRDDNGTRIRDELERRAVNADEIVLCDAPNQFAVILLDGATGERIVLWDRDERLTAGLRRLPTETLTSARLLHVDDVDQDAAIRAAAIGRAAGIPVTSDIDRVTDRTEELVRAVSVAILAEHVPGGLTGEEDLERALRKLRELQTGQLCVTLGSRGAMLLEGDRLYYEPAFQVEAVDTTGAGDVFRGAFIAAFLRGLTPAETLRFANAAAAVSCTRLGAMNGVPTPDEIAAMLKRETVKQA
jgi:sugar/nucleoside kinase (ribokinase family)